MMIHCSWQQAAINAAKQDKQTATKQLPRKKYQSSWRIHMARLSAPIAVKVHQSATIGSMDHHHSHQALVTLTPWCPHRTTRAAPIAHLGLCKKTRYQSNGFSGRYRYRFPSVWLHTFIKQFILWFLWGYQLPTISFTSVFRKSCTILYLQSCDFPAQNNM